MRLLNNITKWVYAITVGGILPAVLSIYMFISIEGHINDSSVRVARSLPESMNVQAVDAKMAGWNKALETEDSFSRRESKLSQEHPGWKSYKYTKGAMSIIVHFDKNDNVLYARTGYRCTLCLN